MIGRLTGRILESEPGEVLLDVGGVGYHVHISLNTFYDLSERPAAQATLHIHTHVREDALTLFGFLTLDERAMFRHLLTISGIGPRLALAILSGIGAGEFRAAVLGGDRARLQKIPGVGKKTAERVLLEMRDRIERDSRVGSAPVGAGPEAGRTRTGGLRGDAVSALTNLGYAEDTASRAVATAIADFPDGDEPHLEQILRAALRSLVK